MQTSVGDEEDDIKGTRDNYSRVSMMPIRLLLRRFLRSLPLVLLLISTVPLVASYDFSVWKIVTGPQNVFVVAVEFPDKKASTDISEIRNRTFTQVNAYYQNVSYGKLSVTGDISDFWVLLPRDMSYYGDYNSENMHSRGAEALINDAIKSSDAFIDFSSFDHVLVVHAGDDEACSRNMTDIWSWGFWDRLSASTEDGVVFNQGAVVSEFDSLGIFCHEFGHVLGLPDLYDVHNSSNTYVGYWGLMAYGSHNDDGSKPSHIMSWGKMFLGWIASPQVAEVALGQSANITVEPLETASTGVKTVRISVTPKAYYLIEVRIDVNLPEQGVLISFVNETRRSGEGIVEIIDSNPTTSTLDDATFHVGAVFEEALHSLTVKVLKQLENSSFVIQISDKLVPYIKVTAPSRVEAYQNIRIDVEVVDLNRTPLSGLLTTLSINEEEHQILITDANGAATFVTNFDVLMLGGNSISISVNGGDYYINNKVEQTIEVIFPPWLLLFAFGCCFIIVIGAVARLATRAGSSHS